MKDVNRMARNSFRLVEGTKIELESPNLRASLLLAAHEKARWIFLKFNFVPADLLELQFLSFWFSSLSL